VIAKYETVASEHADYVQRGLGISRDAALLRVAGATMAANRLEMLNRVIFGSQIAALVKVRDQKAVPIADLRAEYDLAASRYPEMYHSYPFEGWLGFMINNDMIHVENELVTPGIEGIALLWHIQQRNYPLARPL
jgi:hypothetical protein